MSAYISHKSPATSGSFQLNFEYSNLLDPNLLNTIKEKDIFSHDDNIICDYARLLEKKDPKNKNITKYYQKAANGGITRAMTYLGLITYKFNKEKAAKYFKNAMLFNDIIATCTYASLLYQENDFKNAKKYFELVLNAKNDGTFSDIILGDAINNYAMLHTDGNNKKIMSYLLRAIKYGSIYAMYNFAHIMQKSNPDIKNVSEHDLKDVITYLNIAADANHLDAMYELAKLYEQNNHKDALKYYNNIVISNCSNMHFYIECLLKVFVLSNDDEVLHNYISKYYSIIIDNKNINTKLYYKFASIIKKYDSNKYLELLKKIIDNNIATNESNKDIILEYLNKLYELKTNLFEYIKYIKIGVEYNDANSLYKYAIILNNNDSEKYYKQAADLGHIESVIKYCNIIKISNKVIALEYYQKLFDMGIYNHVDEYIDLLNNFDNFENNDLYNTTFNNIKILLEKNLDNVFLLTIFAMLNKDIDIRKKYLLLAIDKNYPVAMHNYALIHIYSDFSIAKYYLLKAIDLGYTNSIFYYAKLMESEDIKIASKYYEIDINNNNNPKSLYTYADILSKNNDTVNKAQLNYIKCIKDNNINGILAYAFYLYGNSHNKKIFIEDLYKRCYHKNNIIGILNYAYILLCENNNSEGNKYYNLAEKLIDKYIISDDINYLINPILLNNNSIINIYHKLYKKTINISNDPSVLYNYGEFLLSKNDKNMALEYFKKSAELGYICSFSRCVILLQNIDLDESKKYIDLGISHNCGVCMFINENLNKTLSSSSLCFDITTNLLLNTYINNKYYKHFINQVYHYKITNFSNISNDLNITTDHRYLLFTYYNKSNDIKYLDLALQTYNNKYIYYLNALDLDIIIKYLNLKPKAFALVNKNISFSTILNYISLILNNTDINLDYNSHDNSTIDNIYTNIIRYTYVLINKYIKDYNSDNVKKGMSKTYEAFGIKVTYKLKQIRIEKIIYVISNLLLCNNNDKLSKLLSQKELNIINFAYGIFNYEYNDKQLGISYLKKCADNTNNSEYIYKYGRIIKDINYKEYMYYIKKAAQLGHQNANTILKLFENGNSSVFGDSGTSSRHNNKNIKNNSIENNVIFDICKKDPKKFYNYYKNKLYSKNYKESAIAYLISMTNITEDMNYTNMKFPLYFAAKHLSEMPKHTIPNEFKDQIKYILKIFNPNNKSEEDLQRASFLDMLESTFDSDITCMSIVGPGDIGPDNKIKDPSENSDKNYDEDCNEECNEEKDSDEEEEKKDDDAEDSDEDSEDENYYEDYCKDCGIDFECECGNK